MATHETPVQTAPTETIISDYTKTTIEHYRQGDHRYTITTVEDDCRIFSKMKAVIALTRLGVWPQVKAWIESQGLYDIYLAAQNFREDDPYFIQGRAALQSALGMTDEQVNAILDECAINSGYRTTVSVGPDK